MILYEFLYLLLFFQEFGIKDEFHRKALMVCVNELCGREQVKNYVYSFTGVSDCLLINYLKLDE